MKQKPDPLKYHGHKRFCEMLKWRKKSMPSKMPRITVAHLAWMPEPDPDPIAALGDL